MDFTSTNVLSYLADLVPRVTIFPFLGGFWLGRHWGWAIVIAVLYHIAISLPIRVLATSLVNVTPFNTTLVLSHNDAFTQYFLGMLCMIIVAAASGHTVSWLFILPHHMVPISHFFTCCWGQRRIGKSTVELAKIRIEAENNIPVSEGYKAWALFGMCILTTLGSFLPYEIIIWLVPNGGASVPAVLMSVIPPLLAALVSLIGFFAFKVPNLFGYSKKEYKKRAGWAVAKITLVHLVPTLAVYVVIYFRRNYHVAWLTFFCGDALLLIIAGIYYGKYSTDITQADVEFLQEEEEGEEEGNKDENFSEKSTSPENPGSSFEAPVYATLSERGGSRTFILM
jgi:hypothetical protein